MIEMTRKQYEETFGASPTISPQSKLDTTPAPRIMTRAEYDAEFRPETKDSGSGGIITTAAKNAFLTTTNNPLVKVAAQEGYSPLSFVKALQEAAASGVEQIKEGVSMTKNQNTRPQGIMKTGAGIINTAFSPVAPLFKPVSDLVNVSGEALSGIPAVQKFAGTKAGELTRNLADFGVDATTVAGALVFPEAGAGIRAKPKVGISEKPSVSPKVPPQELPRASTKVAREIYDIENNYSKLRSVNDYANDAGNASRERIAQTDVLSGAVDTEGVIRTKQPGGAVEQYRKQTIDGVEGVVRDLVTKEKKTVNLAEVERELLIEVYKSRLEGADLLAAKNGIPKEIAGLKLRADEFGNIPLEKIHDAKISTTRNIDYNTPKETKIYRKAVARTYKQIVENKSTTEVNVGGKIYKVKEINKELGKYEGDLERLANLDGKRVKGGKLGKYTAQISGNIIGGVAGAALGPLGMIAGPILGGEAAGFLKGRAMASTFGRQTGFRAAENPILAKARIDAGLPPVKDLSIPDVKVGVPKNIPKTKEIISTEKLIEKNIEAQKSAIKAKDFTLVVALKEIYANLVAKLKDFIKEQIKNTPSMKGGFAKNPLASYSNSLGKRNTQYSKTNIKSTTISESSPTSQKKSTQAVDSVKDVTDIRLSAPLKDSIAKELSEYDIKPLTVSKNGYKYALPDDRIDMRIEELQKKAAQAKGLNDQEYKEVYGLLKTKGIDAKPR